jgi:hypothetical protein
MTNLVPQERQKTTYKDRVETYKDRVEKKGQKEQKKRRGRTEKEEEKREEWGILERRGGGQEERALGSIRGPATSQVPHCSFQCHSQCIATKGSHMTSHSDFRTYDRDQSAITFPLRYWLPPSGFHTYNP